MSRLHEAIRRSSTAGAGSAAGPVTSGEPFRSPWEFDGARDDPARELPSSTRVTDPLSEGGAVIKGFHSQWKERLVVGDSPNPVLVEQFRRLAASLHQAQTTNNIRTVMVTSAAPGDGKTLTAINLALILSESYKRRVLLVDADLRRPSIRDVSHFNNVIGLADGLRAESEQKLTVFQLTPHLSLLPAGRPEPDPMGSLTSSRMERILSDACASFDWVVLDAPPVGTVPDGTLLAEIVDTSLLVVRAGRSDYTLTTKAIEAIGRERILGVVLNAVEGLNLDQYSYYHQAAVSGPPVVNG